MKTALIVFGKSVKYMDKHHVSTATFPSLRNCLYPGRQSWRGMEIRDDWERTLRGSRWDDDAVMMMLIKTKYFRRYRELYLGDQPQCWPRGHQGGLWQLRVHQHWGRGRAPGLDRPWGGGHHLRGVRGQRPLHIRQPEAGHHCEQLLLGRRQWGQTENLLFNKFQHQMC